MRGTKCFFARDWTALLERATVAHIHTGKQLARAIIRFHEKFPIKLATAILEGTFPKERLRVLAKQVYLQEKWPSHIAHVYLGMDEEALAAQGLVNYVLTIIRSENLGVGSKGIPHSVLARGFGQFTGLTDKDLEKAQPTNANRTLMDWCDMSALERPWIESLAVHLACESQAIPMARIAKGLILHYGASDNDIQFFLVHGGPVERNHARQGLALLTQHVKRSEEDGVLYSYKMSCRLLCEFYDSILGG